MKKFNFENKWCFGANFIPSNAINQLEMWQEETFSLDLIERELKFAKGIGMNIMRVFLHDLLYEQDAKGFISRMEKLLEVADKLEIKIMFVFFDDCWNDNPFLGKQPEPRENSHNSGWVKSPGTKAADDLSQRKRLEAYVKGVLTYFKDDERIALWDLYNEPGNGSSGDHLTKTGLRENASLPLLEDVFRWAKEISPSQPYTSGMWNFDEGFNDINAVCLKNSEVVTFHCYEGKENAKKRCEEILEKAENRPVICTEYMARHVKSTFSDMLPLFREKNIGAINWGLVSGKTQTVYPWDSYKEKDRYTMPFHDVFNKDGSLLVPEEEEVFNSIK